MDLQKLKAKNWRLSNLYKIKDRNLQTVTFVPNPAQKHFSEHAWSRNIILKSRRLGFTTYEALDMLDDTLWNRNYDCLMVSYDQESALSLFDEKIFFAWNSFPEEIKKLYGVDTERSSMLKFDFQDNTTSSIQVRTRGRSGTFYRLHISEFAKICRDSSLKAKEIIAGTIPTVPVNGRVDIESTAEGDTGYFYNMFWEAWNRGAPTSPLEYKAHFYNWQWDKEEIDKVPLVEVTPEFKDIQKKHKLTDQEISYYFQKWLSLNKNWNILLQEYPTTPEEAFTYSGTRLFDSEVLEWQNQFIIEPHEIIGGWKMYARYNPSHYYGLGADVAEGIGQDSSTAVIVDFTTLEVVATYQSSKVAPDLFAHEIKRGANLFGACLSAVERNNHGFTTLHVLKDIFFNLYTEQKFDKVDNVTTEKLGWHTTKSTKPKMFFELNDAMNEKKLKLIDKILIQEAKTYDQRDLAKTDFDPEQSSHWDLLTALAICWQLRSVVGLSRYKKTEEELPEPFDPHKIF